MAINQFKTLIMKKFLTTIAIIAVIGGMYINASDRNTADAVTAATEQVETVDVDKVLDKIDRLITKIEKVVKQNREMSEKEQQQLQADLIATQEAVNRLQGVTPTPAQSERAEKLMTRLMNAMAQ